MAVTQALLDQLMELDENERLRVAQLLLSSVDEDNLNDAERARLHGALIRSLQDIEAGRVHAAEDVLAEIQARHRP